MIIHISSFSFTSCNEQRRIVTYLDGSPPTGDASQQAKVNALREFALPALPGTLPKYDNENLECTFDDQIVGFGEGWGGAAAGNFG